MTRRIDAEVRGITGGNGDVGRRRFDDERPACRSALIDRDDDGRTVAVDRTIAVRPAHTTPVGIRRCIDDETRLRRSADRIPGVATHAAVPLVCEAIPITERVQRRTEIRLDRDCLRIDRDRRQGTGSPDPHIDSGTRVFHAAAGTTAGDDDVEGIDRRDRRRDLAVRAIVGVRSAVAVEPLIGQAVARGNDGDFAIMKAQSSDLDCPPRNPPRVDTSFTNFDQNVLPNNVLKMPQPNL